MNLEQRSSHTDLISADRVEGTKVYSTSGENIGQVKDVILHKVSGEVACAVLSFGGFLGMGQRLHPIPWSILKYDTDKDGYIIPLDKDQLKAAPNYSEDELYSGQMPWKDNVFGYYSSRH
jgi:sporulation protein YlmC with PRC-barrel domain